MNIDIESCLDSGEKLATARHALFFRGLGGFGGERGPSTKRRMPARAPDLVHEEGTSSAQALLYRLAGDDNPLHADPAMAAIGNHDKPILHGLCTMGFAARAIMKRCGGNNPNRFDSISVRFSEPVFPGETLVTEMWHEQGDAILFQTRVKERDIIVLSQGAMRLKS